ncbi:hypothetical protein OG298_00695 [Streptomyces sp. NBC_01005]|uniref:hypothetical protein n=1 Tax=unclassified Streptomyces TaxID=2593676 RepID=UPI002E2EBB2C|nr:hypothetical protein [Streptomyces sp. NBC_01362]WSW03009.1 hypothetical protein OG298_00695 [Streptomyces sp. NBC_01005]WTC92516.1 hypothetical protein OH736_00700 [Streptomyces sp. NBC_01650]
MTSFRFPGDLIDLKRRQIRIFNRLALRPAVGAAELQRVLIRLSCLIGAHPYWAEHGRSLAGRVELSRAAQSGPDGVRELIVRWTGTKFVVTEPEAPSS